jgi:hypothetical protein
MIVMIAFLSFALFSTVSAATIADAETARECHDFRDEKRRDGFW